MAWCTIVRMLWEVVGGEGEWFTVLIWKWFTVLVCLSPIKLTNTRWAFECKFRRKRSRWPGICITWLAGYKRWLLPTPAPALLPVRGWQLQQSSFVSGAGPLGLRPPHLDMGKLSQQVRHDVACVVRVSSEKWTLKRRKLTVLTNKSEQNKPKRDYNFPSSIYV